MRRLLLLGSLILLCSNVLADATLDDLLSEAARENAGVRAAFENWQAALSRVAYSNSLPDPKLSYGHFIESVETRVGPQRFRLGLAQMIPWLGKLKSRKDLATQQALLAEKELASAHTDLTKELISALYTYRYLVHSVGIQQDYIELSRVLEQTAQAQTKVGRSSADVIQAQMLLHRLGFELESLKERRATALARVNSLLNRPIDLELALPINLDPLLQEEPRRLTITELEEVNPDLQVSRAKVDVHGAKQNLAKQNGFPDVTVGLDWIKTDHALMSTPDSGKDPVVASISINVPIWRSSYRSQEKEAYAQLQRASRAYDQDKYRAEALQEEILAAYSDAVRQVELYRDLLLPEAEKALSILTEVYKNGQTDFERLQNAQIALLELQLKSERASSDLGIAHARYQALIGGGIDEP